MQLTYVTEMYQREKGEKIRRFAKNAAGVACAYQSQRIGETIRKSTNDEIC